ncbi:hypothetical protein RAA17_01115 [Komagataeibacter rhaeticus]|nr:hypothetical protein [Komagataeibacter rhaeticus]
MAAGFWWPTPFQLAQTARDALTSLCGYLGDGEAQAHVEWVVPE